MCDANWVVRIPFCAGSPEQARAVARVIAEAAGVLLQVEHYEATYAPIGDEQWRSPVYEADTVESGGER